MKLSFKLAVVMTGTIAAAACRTTGGASLKDAAIPPPAAGTATETPQSATASGFDTPQGVPAPFAKGTTEGLFWEARFNMPPCDHPPKKKGAFCTTEDQKAGAAASGVEAELAAWANDPNIKSLQMAYFSFSDSAVIKILCEAANTRGIMVNVYLHRENMTTPGAKQLQTCSPAHIQVIPRGTAFGSGYLQHAKIFMASPDVNPRPLHLMPPDQQAAALQTVTHFTSSSANMSAYGTSLHFDNWLFYTARTNEYLVQENLCFFNSMATMTLGTPDGERQDFANKNRACLNGITIPMRKDIVFYPVPHAGVTRPIFPEVQKAMDGAQTEIKMVDDRLTTKSVWGPLAAAKARGVNVHVILDDDTLRTGKCDGGPAPDQGAMDVGSMRSLIGAGIEVSFMESNGEIGQLQHNKFVVFDNKMLLQGAGNFTSTSLNIFGLGNFEHFYMITTPEIVQAYSKAWDVLRGLTTNGPDHEVWSHKDMPIVNGQLDSSVCN